MINSYSAFDDKVYLETRKLVDLLLNENLNYLELAARTHIPVERIKSRLNNDAVIKMVYPNKNEEILQKIKERMIELDNKKNDSPHYLRIDIFSKNDLVTQKKILLHLALSFRAKFETINALFGLSMYDILNSNDLNEYYDALKYLNIESFDQEIAKNNIINFYNQYVQCLRKKDIEGIRLLLRNITDHYAQALRKKKEGDGIFTDEDILTMLKYQLKYGLKIKQISSIFMIDRNTYAERIQIILAKEGNELLKEQYNQLFEYNMAMGEKYRRHG